MAPVVADHKEGASTERVNKLRYEYTIPGLPSHHIVNDLELYLDKEFEFCESLANFGEVMLVENRDLKKTDSNLRLDILSRLVMAYTITQLMNLQQCCDVTHAGMSHVGLKTSLYDARTALFHQLHPLLMKAYLEDEQLFTLLEKLLQNHPLLMFQCLRDPNGKILFMEPDHQKKKFVAMTADQEKGAKEEEAKMEEAKRKEAAARKEREEKYKTFLNLANGTKLGIMRKLITKVCLRMLFRIDQVFRIPNVRSRSW